MEYAIGRGIAAIRHRNGSRYQPFVQALVEFRMPRLLAKVAGSTFPNLSSSELLGLLVGLPLPDEQRTIADILDSIDLVIEQNVASCHALEVSKASTADNLLSGRVRVGKIGV